MKKRGIVILGLLVALLALVLAGCPDTNNSNGGGEPPDPDTADFGEGATIEEPFAVTSVSEFASAIGEITAGGNNKNYIITIDNDIERSGSIDFGSFQGAVSFRGTGTLTLTNTAPSALLYVKAGQTISLRGLTLTRSGGENDSCVIVYVEDGTFTMQSGAVAENPVGHGVGVGSGTFIMNGGSIRGNDHHGVQTSGIFTMSGGDIHDNAHNGVYLGAGGTFTMIGGRIYGNGEDNERHGVSANGTFNMSGGSIFENSKNGVYLRGTFSMSGGSIYNNGNNGVSISSTDDAAGGSRTFNLNRPATKASIYGNADHQVYVPVGGTFKVNGVTTEGY